MKTVALLAALALPAAAAPAAKPAAPAAKPAAKSSRTSGKVLQSKVRVDQGRVVEGRLIVLDKAGHTEEFKVTPATKVTLDGMPAKFEAVAVPEAPVEVVYDPRSKLASSVALKPAPKPDSDDPKGVPASRGALATVNAAQGLISVRVGGMERPFAVPASAKIRVEKAGKSRPAALKDLAAGDEVEVFSRDGKTAVEVHARKR